MITLHSATKSYFGDTRVLDQVSLDLKRGDFLYVVGGSGAGKSSLLRLMATEEHPTAGTVQLLGYDLSKVSSGMLRSIRQALGYVPQDVRLIPDLSVYDNIALSAALSSRRAPQGAERRQRIHELLEEIGLAGKRDKLASQLSGGEAQRVAVARALVRNPDIIVADEPTGAQDRDFTWKLMEMLLKANARGATVVVATHDREMVRRVRKPCATLRDGRVLMEEGLFFY